jgi:hypothetical protein
MFHQAVFRKRKWIQFYFMMSAGEMGHQLVAEQLGIGARQEDMHFFSKQAVDKQRPTVNVLDFIKK